METNPACIWVVIPTWNRKHDLLPCLVSVRQSDYPHIHIVVVDNASNDGSIEAVQTHFPGVALVGIEKNHGAAYASNRGFEFALLHGADLVLRLDSDTILASDYISKLAAVVKKEPSIGIVSGKLFYHSHPDKIWLTGSKLIKWNLGTKEISLSELNQLDKDVSIEVDFVPSTGMLIKKDVLDKLKGFDQDYLVYYEDYDFCLKVKRLGYKILVEPSACLWHKVFSQKKSPWIAEQWNKSKMIYFRKNALSYVHKVFLVCYAFIYAIFRSIFSNKAKGNRGPLLHALKGLINGLKFPISNSQNGK